MVRPVLRNLEQHSDIVFGKLEHRGTSKKLAGQRWGIMVDPEPH
jgi:hypothetical protein